MIPSSIEEVTPAWLTGAFSENYPGAVINDAKIDRVIHGTSSKWFLNLGRNAAAVTAGIPEKICIKVNWEAHADKTLSLAIWCLEGRFYKSLRPQLPAPAPMGYFGDYDEATGQGICI